MDPSIHKILQILYLPLLLIKLASKDGKFQVMVCIIHNFGSLYQAKKKKKGSNVIAQNTERKVLRLMDMVCFIIVFNF